MFFFFLAEINPFCYKFFKNIPSHTTLSSAHLERKERNNSLRKTFMIFSSSRAAVIVREEQLSELPEILSAISPSHIKDLQRQGRFYWQQYFKSIKDITLTTLQIINDRMYPYTAKDYTDWNEPRPRVSEKL